MERASDRDKELRPKAHTQSHWGQNLDPYESTHQTRFGYCQSTNSRLPGKTLSSSWLSHWRRWYWKRFGRGKRERAKHSAQCLLRRSQTHGSAEWLLSMALSSSIFSLSLTLREQGLRSEWVREREPKGWGELSANEPFTSLALRKSDHNTSLNKVLC